MCAHAFGVVSRHIVYLLNWRLRVFEIRQLLVGDILPDLILSPEYWRARYWEFLFHGFDCGTLNNL